MVFFLYIFSICHFVSEYAHSFVGLIFQSNASCWYITYICYLCIIVCYVFIICFNDSKFYSCVLIKEKLWKGNLFAETYCEWKKNRFLWPKSRVILYEQEFISGLYSSWTFAMNIISWMHINNKSRSHSRTHIYTHTDSDTYTRWQVKSPLTKAPRWKVRLG